MLCRCGSWNGVREKDVLSRHCGFSSNQYIYPVVQDEKKQDELFSRDSILNSVADRA